MTTMTKLPIAGLVLALALTGCAKEDEATAKARAELAGLPSLDETKTALQGAMEQIVKGAKVVIPKAQWKDGGNETTVSCNGAYSDLGGSMYYAPNRVAIAVAMKPEQWAKIQAAATDPAAKIGAKDVEVRFSQPTNQEVWFRGPAGMVIELAYQGNLSIAGTTGCRRPAGG